MGKGKKKTGCFTRIVQLFIILIIIGALSNAANDETKTTTSSGGTIRPTATSQATVKPTVAPTIAPTVEPTAAPTTAPTIEPTAKPLTIYLVSPNLGEYGKYYTFNESVAKAEASDKETIIQCFVPAGTYTVTNEGKYPTFVLVYSAETVISEDGWEEPAETWGSSMLKVGDSCEVTVKEGYYINLQENDVFKLIQK